MIRDALLAGGRKPVPACLADRRAAALAFVVGGDVADPGVQAHRVELVAYPVQLGPRTAGSSMRSRWGQSALTWLNRLSIQAWSVGVPGRPKCWAMAHMAMNSRVEPEVICGPAPHRLRRAHCL